MGLRVVSLFCFSNVGSLEPRSCGEWFRSESGRQR